MSRGAESSAEPGRRAAGILLPLFALRSTRDWGIGEIGDLPALCRWLATAGHHVLQLLPIAEMPAAFSCAAQSAQSRVAMPSQSSRLGSPEPTTIRSPWSTPARVVPAAKTFVS